MNTIENIETLKPYIDLNSLLSVRVKQQSKADFITFVRKMAPSLVSDFKMGKHIEVISEKLQQLESGEIKRLMVFLPPRSSKSVICSKLFPAWYIGRNPEHEILTVSHSDQLSSDFGRSVRDVVNDEKFVIKLESNFLMDYDEDGYPSDVFVSMEDLFHTQSQVDKFIKTMEGATYRLKQ